jgi:hypothetical protein
VSWRVLWQERSEGELRVRARACWRKRLSFPSRAAAEAECRWRATARGWGLRPYRCWFCGRWHLTSRADEATV